MQKHEWGCGISSWTLINKFILLQQNVSEQLRSENMQKYVQTYYEVVVYLVWTSINLSFGNKNVSVPLSRRDTLIPE